jgi:GAF domain-containing protein
MSLPDPSAFRPSRPAGASDDRAEDVAVVLAELAGLLVEEQTLQSTLRKVLDVATRVIDGCDAAGVTITAGSGARTAAYTDRRTLTIDSQQYDAGDGPCLEAARTGRPQRIDHLDQAETRWPGLARAAHAVGIRGLLAAPLEVNGELLGALNMYTRQEGGFDGLDEAFLRLFVGQASAAVANARQYERLRLLAAQLEQALTSRAVIEQAKGVIAARYAVDPETAFAYLRRQSQDRNVKLREVAAEVVRACHDGEGREPGG